MVEPVFDSGSSFVNADVDDEKRSDSINCPLNLIDISILPVGYADVLDHSSISKDFISCKFRTVVLMPMKCSVCHYETITAEEWLMHFEYPEHISMNRVLRHLRESLIDKAVQDDGSKKTDNCLGHISVQYSQELFRFNNGKFVCGVCGIFVDDVKSHLASWLHDEAYMHVVYPDDLVKIRQNSVVEYFGVNLQLYQSNINSHLSSVLPTTVENGLEIIELVNEKECIEWVEKYLATINHALRVNANPASEKMTSSTVIGLLSSQKCIVESQQANFCYACLTAFCDLMTLEQHCLTYEHLKSSYLYQAFSTVDNNDILINETTKLQTKLDSQRIIGAEFLWELWNEQNEIVGHVCQLCWKCFGRHQYLDLMKHFISNEHSDKFKIAMYSYCGSTSPWLSDSVEEFDHKISTLKSKSENIPCSQKMKVVRFGKLDIIGPRSTFGGDSISNDVADMVCSFCVTSFATKSLSDHICSMEHFINFLNFGSLGEQEQVEKSVVLQARCCPGHLDENHFLHGQIGTFRDVEKCRIFTVCQLLVSVYNRRFIYMAGIDSVDAMTKDINVIVNEVPLLPRSNQCGFPVADQKEPHDRSVSPEVIVIIDDDDEEVGKAQIMASEDDDQFLTIPAQITNSIISGVISSMYASDHQSADQIIAGLPDGSHIHYPTNNIDNKPLHDKHLLLLSNIKPTVKNNILHEFWSRNTMPTGNLYPVYSPKRHCCDSDVRLFVVFVEMESHQDCVDIIRQHNATITVVSGKKRKQTVTTHSVHMCSPPYGRAVSALFRVPCPVKRQPVKIQLNASGGARPMTIPILPCNAGSSSSPAVAKVISQKIDFPKKDAMIKSVNHCAARDVILSNEGLYVAKVLQTGINYLLVQGIKQSMTEDEVSYFVRARMFTRLRENVFHFAYTIDPPYFEPVRMELFFVRFLTHQSAQLALKKFNNSTVEGMVIRLFPLTPLTEDIRVLTASRSDIPPAVRSALRDRTTSTTSWRRLGITPVSRTTLVEIDAKSSASVQHDVVDLTVGPPKVKRVVASRYSAGSFSTAEYGELADDVPPYFVDASTSSGNNRFPSSSTTGRSLDTVSLHPRFGGARPVGRPDVFPFSLLPQNGQLLMEHGLDANRNGSYLLISGLPVELIERLLMINEFCDGNFMHSTPDLSREANSVISHLRFLVRSFLDPFPANLINLVYISGCSGDPTQFDQSFCVVSSCVLIQCGSLAEAQSVARSKDYGSLMWNDNLKHSNIFPLNQLRVVAISESTCPEIVRQFARRKTNCPVVVRPPLDMETLRMMSIDSTAIKYVVSKQIIDRVSTAELQPAQRLATEVLNFLVVGIDLTEAEKLSLISQLHNAILWCLVKNRGICWGGTESRRDGSLKRRLPDRASYHGPVIKKHAIAVNFQSDSYPSGHFISQERSDNRLQYGNLVQKSNFEQCNSRFEIPSPWNMGSQTEALVDSSKLASLNVHQLSIIRSLSARLADDRSKVGATSSSTAPISKYGLPSMMEPLVEQKRTPEMETTLLRQILTKITTNSLNCDHKVLIPAVTTLGTSSETNQNLASIILSALFENKDKETTSQPRNLGWSDINRNQVEHRQSSMGFNCGYQVESRNNNSNSSASVVSSLDSLLAEALALMDK